MGFSFQVASCQAVWNAPFGQLIQEALEAQCGDGISGIDNTEVYTSQELHWGWWSAFQEYVKEEAGEEFPHLLGLAAWASAYLPQECDLFLLSIEREMLCFGSTVILCDELMELSESLQMPDTVAACEKLRRAFEDSDSPDDEPMLQTFVELKLAAEESITRRQPLWLIK